MKFFYRAAPELHTVENLKNFSTATCCFCVQELHNFAKMSCICQEECSLCHTGFRGRRHRHPEGWSPSLIAFFKDESGFNVGNSDVCVCGACDVSIRHALKCREKMSLTS